LWAANNTYFADHPPMIDCGGKLFNLSAWDLLWAGKGIPGGGERGSQVKPMPTTDVVIAILSFCFFAFFLILFNTTK